MHMFSLMLSPPIYLRCMCIWNLTRLNLCICLIYRAFTSHLLYLITPSFRYDISLYLPLYQFHPFAPVLLAAGKGGYVSMFRANTTNSAATAASKMVRRDNCNYHNQYKCHQYHFHTAIVTNIFPTLAHPFTTERWRQRWWQWWRVAVFQSSW